MSEEQEKVKFAEIMKDITLSQSSYAELEFLYINKPDCIDAERFKEIALQMQE